MTPHNKMGRVREMIERNAFLADGLSTYGSIFMGDQFQVTADDERTQQEMNQWLEQSGLKHAMANGGVGKHFKGFGNAYYHVRKGRVTGVPKKFELITRPDDMWIQLDENGEVDYYVLEVPTELRGAGDQEYDTHMVSYGRNGYEKHSVTGVRYETDEILHVPQNMSKVQPYGVSDLASASSDEKILREIERSYGIMARHKQVPKKIFQFFEEMDGERMPVDSETFESKIKPQLNNLKDKDNPIFNGSWETDVIDYGYGGEEIKMQETINYLKRKVTSPVGPQFLMHGDMTTNAVSTDQKATFFMEIKGDREQHKQKLLPIFRRVAEQKDLDADSIGIEFGTLQFTTEQSRRQQTVEHWNQGLITLDEARQELGYESASGELPDETDPFKWEVQSQPQPNPQQSVQQSLRDILDSE